MKKLFRSYLISCAVLLVLFNILAFVVPSGKHAASFWVGYGFIALAILGQLACAWLALGREDNSRKLFCNLTLLTISRTGLILTFVFGGATMLLSLPAWVGVILCTVVLAFTAIAVGKASSGASYVAQVEEKVEAQTAFIRHLTVEAKNLLSAAKTDGAKAACRRVYEAARYSDPKSHPALAAVEGAILAQVRALATAIAAGREDAILAASEELVALLGERSRLCKLNKA